MDSNALTPNTELVTACILTGGKGSRLDGVDKGLLQISDRNLIEYCIEKIRPQVGTTIISANRNIQTYRNLGLHVFEDSFGNYEGPLAGFLSGLENTKTPYLVILPTDSPFFPKDLVKRLLTPILSGRCTASVAKVSGRIQPTFCCIPKESRHSLTDYLRSGQRKIVGWLKQLELMEISFEIPEEFININNETDLSLASTYLLNEKKI